MTAMQLRSPEEMVRRISWRHRRRDLSTWALPQALPSRVSADAVQARRRRRPAGTAGYLLETFTLTLMGELGPDPDDLLSQLIDRIRTLLTRPISRAQDGQNLQPDEFHDYRKGDGSWAGSLRLRIVSDIETRHVHTLFHGGTVQIAGTYTPINCFSPRIDASAHLRQEVSG